MDPNAVTIVTGGGRGIGRAIALRMAKETTVVVVGRTEADLSGVCKEIADAGGSAFAVVGDVTDLKTAMRAERICRDLPVRNLVLNAGLGKSKPAHEFGPLFDEIMNVNLMGAVRFIEAFMPKMLAQGGGNVVLMSSVSGLVGSRHNAPYVASKHALVGLAKTMAKDYGADGVVTVAVCPGFVETDMTERSIRKRMDLKGMTREEARRAIEHVNPQHRIIPPAEVAEMVAFVCSGKVPSLSGSAIVLSGGV